MIVFRRFLIATQFLTRLPVPLHTNWTMGDLKDSVALFPLVGILVGLIGGLVYALGFLLNVPADLAAIMTVAVMVLVTGGLHEDGLADVADGFGGGRMVEAKLEIMRDSRLGSYGAIALIIVLTARIKAIALIVDPWMVGAVLIVAAALSRAAMPAAMRLFPQARADGLAASAGRPTSLQVILGLGFGMLIAVLCLAPGMAILLIGVITIVSGVFLAFARRQIGGISGDVLGGLQQIVELSCLITLVAMASTA